MKLLVASVRSFRLLLAVDILGVEASSRATFCWRLRRTGGCSRGSDRYTRWRRITRCRRSGGSSGHDGVRVREAAVAGHPCERRGWRSSGCCRCRRCGVQGRGLDNRIVATSLSGQFFQVAHVPQAAVELVHALQVFRVPPVPGSVILITLIVWGIEWSAPEGRHDGGWKEKHDDDFKMLHFYGS